MRGYHSNATTYTSYVYINHNQLPQAPPLSYYPAVPYYTVTHNISTNSSELALNTTGTVALLNGTRHRETYTITVSAVNAVGVGISAYTTITS